MGDMRPGLRHGLVPVLLALAVGLALPRRTDAGLALRWSSRTPGICRVERRSRDGRSLWVVEARRRGTCWLRAENAGSDAYAPVRVTRTLRIA